MNNNTSTNASTNVINMTRKKTYSRDNFISASRKHSFKNTYLNHNTGNRNNYITKLVNKYYDNDDNSHRYLRQASRITHIFPAQRRVIVIGDIHGDFEIAIKCLILAGCIKYIEPPNNKTVSVMDAFFNTLEWIGADTHVVQLGDQIDRVRPQQWDANDISRDTAFEDEGSTLEIFYLFHYLDELAKKHGGRVLSIIGNHEIMNVAGDFRYVSKKEFQCFKNHLQHIYHRNSKFPYHSKTLKRGRLTLYNTKHNTKLPQGYRERLYAFSPTGLCANLMAMNYYTMLQIGNWLFCHGSPTITTVEKYPVSMINNIISLYLLGIDSKDSQLEKHFHELTQSGNDIEPSILWSRTFGETNTMPEKQLSKILNKILDTYNHTNNNTKTENKATHIAIGHTPQFNKGINAICNQHVWRCDVAMSRAFKHNNHNINNANNDFQQGNIQVLEILNGKPNILHS